MSENSAPLNNGESPRSFEAGSNPNPESNKALPTYQDTDYRTGVNMPHSAPSDYPVSRSEYPVSGELSHDQKSYSGLAIGALVLGIVSLPFCWIPFFGLFSGVTALIGIILGAISFYQLKHSPVHKGRGMSLTGLILSIVALVLLIIVNVWTFFLLGTVDLDEDPEFRHSYSSSASSSPEESASLSASPTVSTPATPSAGDQVRNGNFVWKEITPGHGSPQGIVKQFFLAMEDKDYNKLCQEILDPTLSGNEAARKACLAEAKNMDPNKGGITEGNADAKEVMENSALEVTLEGDKHAQVKAFVLVLPTIEIDGKWYLDNQKLEAQMQEKSNA